MNLNAVSQSGRTLPIPVQEAASSRWEAVVPRQRFLNACHCQPTDYPPVWLMRQAGRALPEYRELKKRYSFLELVQNPELAAEVTLQPIRRFGFDAAILFSDILVIPEAMGQPYHFRDSGGIEMAFTLNTPADIERLEVKQIRERLSYVSDALKLIRTELGQTTALLGFAGSPWTLANFMIEGGSAKEYSKAKLLFYTQPRLFYLLMEKITAAVAEFLQMQIESGVDAIQLFDSLGGNLSHHLFEPLSAQWMKAIISRIDGRVPVIVYAKGVHENWRVLTQTGAQIIGADWMVNLFQVGRQLPRSVALQGNLDPCLMCATPEAVEIEAKRILQETSSRHGFIFNLGHGLPPNAKLENIEKLVATVRGIA